jgi:CHASE2 domain-containing sensor protein/signal transduction histidine kinase
VTLALLLIGFALLLVYSDWLWRWDRVFYDAQLRLWQRPPPDDVVIIAIDEQTLRRFGRWPWPRARHAELLRTLTREQPSVIGFDVIFAEPNLQHPQGDAALVKAVKHSGKVVLPVLMEQPRHDGQPIETLPFPALASVAAALGHVHVELDPDGIARTLFLYEGLGGSPYWPHLSLAMLALGSDNNSVTPAPDLPGSDSESPLIWARSQPLLIPFAGPPGHFYRISYSQVISGDFSPGTFKDKIVLVGTTTAGLGDALPTPFSGFSHSMPGVEINANIFDALRRNLTISQLEKQWQMLLTGILALLPIVFFVHRSPRTNLLLAGALLLVTLAVSAGLLVVLNLWFPPSATLLAITLSYPLWSWRHLELAMRYLGQELDRLHQQQRALAKPRQIPLEEALGFASEILPISGWILVGEDGRPVASQGQAPNDRPGQMDSAGWVRQGDCLWTQLERPEQTLTLGLRWAARSPGKAQEQLLDAVLRRSEQVATLELRTAEKGLQARIAQVQQATTRLRELRRFIDDGLANMADGVVVTDLHGQVLLSNTRAAWYLCGDDDARLIDLPVLTLLHEVHLEQGGEWSRLLQQVMLENVRVQSGARHGDGRDLLVQVAPLNSDDRGITGLVFTLSDISLLKASERKRDELLNFLSHDLRAPLVSLTALLDLARHEQPGEPLSGLLNRMESCTAKTLNMAEQFLHLARAESSESVAYHDVDMVSVAMNAIEQVWGQASARNIRLDQQIEVDEAWLSGDGGLLERALVNLLDNAIKYSAPDSTVTLRLSITGQQLRCCVSDQGVGIPSAELPHLFDRFHRVQLEGVQQQRGAGLGLALVAVVARRHTGQIDVSSTPGEGSDFCLVLPFHGNEADGQ